MATPVSGYVTRTLPEKYQNSDLTDFMNKSDKQSLGLTVVNSKFYPAATINSAVAALVTEFGSTPCTLLVTNALTLSASLSVPANIALVFIEGGKITSSNGAFILTINGSLTASPAQKIFDGSFITTPGTVAFSISSAVHELFAAWWGVANGTDSTTAFRAAYAACKGTAGGYDNRGRTLRIPPGRFTLSEKHVFRPTGRHRGVIVQGAGVFNTVLDYTYNAAEADNFLIYHDLAVDGAAIDWAFRDMIFLGPGGLSNAGFMFTTSTGGSGAHELSNVWVDKFKKGSVIKGTANNDRFYWNRVTMTEVDEMVYCENPQTVWCTFDACMFIGLAASVTGFVFSMKAGGRFTITGGGFTPSGTATVFRFPTDFNAVRQAIFCYGFHGELQGASKLFDDAPTTNFGERMIMMDGCGVSVLGSPTTRNIITIRDGGRLIFDRGTLSGGAAELISTNSAYVNGPPELSMRGTVWLSYTSDKITETYTGSANRPIVRLHEMGIDSGTQSRILDRETGPMTTLTRGQLVRNRKVAYLAAFDGVAFQYVFPGNTQTRSIVLPRGSNIEEIALVMLQTYTGSTFTATIDNGDGSTVYIAKSITTGGFAAFEEIKNTVLTRNEISGVNETVRWTNTGNSSSPSGYVRIVYY